MAEQRSEFLSLKGGCRGLSESKLVKIPHCWKSRVMAHMELTAPEAKQPPHGTRVRLIKMPEKILTTKQGHTIGK